jgi:hypothetical protein
MVTSVGNATTVVTNTNLTGDISSSGSNATTITTNAVTSAKILDGEIINADINASAAIVDTKLATIATVGKVSNSATSATALNTASTIVARDGSGNFSAGTITATAFSGPVTGNITGNTSGTSANVTGIVLGANGGTGIDNSGKTITLGGNLTTTGAFATTLTSSAATTVTLPTTGTLATLDGSETLTNKTLTAPALGTPSVLVGTNITGTAVALSIGGNAATANTATNLVAGLGGQIPYQTGANTTAMLANGTAGQVLQSNGTALPPSWVSAATGDMTLAGTQTVTGAKTFGAAGNVGKLIIAGTTSGTTILNANATAGTGTVTLPTTGTLATLDGVETLTNKTLTSPTLTDPALGTPASGVMTNVTGTASALTAGLATSLVGGSGGTIPYQSAAGTTAMLANGTAGQVLRSNGTTVAPSWAAAGVGTIGGSGTLNYVPKFTGGTTLGNSLIFDNGTNVGIGTTTPGQLLEVGTFNTTNSTIKTGSLELQPFSLNNAWLGENAYFNNGWKYRATGGAGLFYFMGAEGQFRFFESGIGGNALPGFGGNVQFKVNANGTVALGGTISADPENYTGSTLIATGDKVGIGTITPTARLHIAAGTATANTAPLKLTQSGAVLLTTPEPGTIEANDGDLLYYTIKTGAARKTLAFTSDVATSLDGLTDAKSGGTNFTGSLIIGHQPTGPLTTAEYNTAIGIGALQAITTGDNNTATGADALINNTTGSWNTANGNSALYSNNTGFNNTASGYRALMSNTIGTSNTANGRAALQNNTTGGDNTASGVQALNFNTTGDFNTASGRDALYSNVAGSRATAIGTNAMYYANNTATPFTNTNVAVGFEALKGSTAASANTGNNNTALGYQTLLGNTTGTYNTASGANALYSNTTGNNNTASGKQALYNNISGIQNTASGSLALLNNTIGNNNTASGLQALYANLSGSNNTANGVDALSENQGDYNTASGVYALYNNTSGSNNIASGLQALVSNGTGSYNTAIGYSADVVSGALTNATAIGNGAVVNASNKVRIGNGAVTVIEGQVAFTALSDRRFKTNIQPMDKGLAFIMQLKPVSYLIKNTSDTRTNWGFIAQDIENLVGTDNAVLTIGQDSERTLGLRYTDFISPMVKAMQEQQKVIEELNQKLEEANSELRTQNAELKSQISTINDQLFLINSKLGTQVQK